VLRHISAHGLQTIVAPSSLKNHCSLSAHNKLIWDDAYNEEFDGLPSIQLKDCVLRHVSTHGLQTIVAPSSLKNHCSLSPHDKLIWDDGYNEEFDGLTSITTLEVSSKSQIKILSKGCKILPSVAISTIKYDEHNILNGQNIMLLFLAILVIIIGQKNLWILQ